jgi:hypothetical protein
VITDFSKAITKRLLERIVAHQEALGAGSCADFAAYRYQCGRIHELKAAAEIIQEELKRYDQDDDA